MQWGRGVQPCPVKNPHITSHFTLHNCTFTTRVSVNHRLHSTVVHIYFFLNWCISGLMRLKSRLFTGPHRFLKNNKYGMPQYYSVIYIYVYVYIYIYIYIYIYNTYMQYILSIYKHTHIYIYMNSTSDSVLKNLPST